MRCSKCGNEVPDNAQFCYNCGERINSGQSSDGSVDYNSGRDYENGNYRSYKSGGYGNNQKPPSSNALIVVVIVLAAILLFVIAAFVAKAGIADFLAPSTTIVSPEITAEATPEITPEIIYITPEPQNEPVRQPAPPQGNAGYTESVVRYPSYSTYRDSQYGFQCNYPSHYLTYDDGLGTSRYTVRAADGNAIEKICAKVNTGETVSGEMQQYINSHTGYVDYKTSGSDYFAVSMVNGNMHNYRYSKFKNGNIYWFEFEYTTSNYADVYDEYINDIYKSFTIY